MKAKLSTAMTDPPPTPQTLLTFSFSVRVWPWSSGNHSDPCILIEFSNKQTLMLKDSDQSMDTIRTTSRLCPSSYVSYVRGVCATHTHVHTHPFTLMHTPVSYQDELKAKFLHRQMRPTECIKRVLLCTSWAGEMQMDPSPSVSSEDPHRRRAGACLLHSVACCSRRHRFAPAITSSHLGAPRFC